MLTTRPEGEASLRSARSTSRVAELRSTLCENVGLASLLDSQPAVVSDAAAPTRIATTARERGPNHTRGVPLAMTVQRFLLRRRDKERRAVLRVRNLEIRYTGWLS